MVEEPEGPDEEELAEGSDDVEDDDLGEGDEEASLDEILAKRPDAPEPEEDEESFFDLTPEERVESLTVRAIPKQANEFVCASCRLVKYNSQLADAVRQLCRDCV